MTKNIWIISDTHFGHNNIIKYCDRPFKDIDEMDEKMIENWNRVVKPGDKVYHLGDVYMGSGERFLKKFARLNGRKRLVLGNHDDLKRNIDGKIRLGDLFDKIYLFRCFKEFGLMLSHVPVHPDSIIRAGEGAINIHGHIHEKSVKKEVLNGGYEHNDNRYKCVCVEHINYTPVNIEELRVI